MTRAQGGGRVGSLCQGGDVRIVSPLPAHDSQCAAPPEAAEKHTARYLKLNKFTRAERLPFQFRSLVRRSPTKETRCGSDKSAENIRVSRVNNTDSVPSTNLREDRETTLESFAFWSRGHFAQTCSCQPNTPRATTR